jgi:phenylpropionate dioxygenase-like ring-hydroxylating dioxygenase large terminal subunit
MTQHWLRNAWYVGMYSHDLPRGSVASRTVLGTPLALFREPSGAVVALEDQCPHRAAPLSLGKLVDGGRLRCGYHGLEFNGSGRCVHNPHGKGIIPPGMAVRAFPTLERYGLVWIWTGEGAADATLIPNYPVFESGAGFAINHPDWLRMSVPYDLIIDNLLDLSHASYLHEGLLGNIHMISGADIAVRREGDAVVVTREMSDKPPPEYFDLLYMADGRPADVWNDARWQAPAHVLLDNGCTAHGTPRSAGGRIYVAHLITPETDSTSLYHIVAARKLPEGGRSVDEAKVNARLAELRRIAFSMQDEPMIQAQYRAIQRSGGRFVGRLLPIDGGAALWRRIIDGLIEAEQTPSMPESSP